MAKKSFYSACKLGLLPQTFGGRGDRNGNGAYALVGLTIWAPLHISELLQQGRYLDVAIHLPF